MRIEHFLMIWCVMVWYAVGILAIAAADGQRWIMQWISQAPNRFCSAFTPMIWPLLIWSLWFGGIRKRIEKMPGFVRRTLKERIVMALFPPRYIEEPFTNDFYKGLRGCDVIMKFSFLDRIRLLFGGSMFIQIYVLTDIPVGRMNTAGGGYVLPPELFNRKPTKKKPNSKLRSAVAGAFGKWRR